MKYKTMYLNKPNLKKDCVFEKIVRTEYYTGICWG